MKVLDPHKTGMPFDCYGAAAVETRIVEVAARLQKSVSGYVRTGRFSPIDKLAANLLIARGDAELFVCPFGRAYRWTGKR